jgi:hypothetical protein
MTSLSDSARLMYRSRHLYILAGGLVNLALGLYLHRHSGGWRRAAQAVGSALLMVSPLLLVFAFAVEPSRGFQQETWLSHFGLYALFGGSMVHLLCGPPRKI